MAAELSTGQQIKKKVIEEAPMPTHAAAINIALKYLTDEIHGVISDLSEIDAVGHRVAQGGGKVLKSGTD